jgi:DedD protein
MTMTKTKPPAAPEAPAETGELRGQLVKRLAVAGALVAVLLGVLALFDQLSSQNDEFDAPTYTKPVPVQAKKPVTQAVTPIEAQPAEPPPAEKPEPPPPPEPVATTPVLEPAVPARSKAPPPPKPPAPGVAKGVNGAGANSASPASPASPASSTSHTAANATGRGAPPSARIREETVAPAISSQPAAANATPSVQVVDTSSSPVRRLFSGFVVQAGVFSSAQRAEELQAQLTLNGVPATLEARVQVGPFKTRQEAEAAQEKLRKMGIESLLVPPKSGKRRGGAD